LAPRPVGQQHGCGVPNWASQTNWRLAKQIGAKQVLTAVVLHSHLSSSFSLALSPYLPVSLSKPTITKPLILPHFFSFLLHFHSKSFVFI